MELIAATQVKKRKVVKAAPKAAAPKPPPRDVCAEMTEKLVAQLEKGVAPWIQPWNGDGGVPGLGGLPRNAVTNRSYHGANILVLWCAGYSDPRWLTFKQALEMGGNVRRGEKGQTICWWSKVTRKTGDAVPEGTEENAKSYLVCRSFTVFNVEQCENLTLDKLTLEAPVAGDPSCFIADEVAKRVGAKVIFGGTEAAYSPLLDRIKMPVRAAFTSDEDYNGTHLHELTHWTGHSSRCDRKFGKRFGDRAYAFEELVAEFGAAFTCALLGVKGKLQHPEYLGHWASILKADKHAIFTAAREAEKACRVLVPETESSDESEGD